LAERFPYINYSLLKMRAYELKGKKIEKAGMWSQYQSLKDLEKILYCDDVSFFDSNRFGRYKDIIMLLKEIRPTRVLEIGANAGLFAVAACKYCETIEHYVATDYDDKAINNAYIFCKKYKEKFEWLKKLKTLVVDFSGGYEHKNHEPIGARLKADAVICMAVTHHFILSQGISCEAIFRSLHEVTQKFLLIEFMPLGLWSGGDVLPKLPGYYSLEWFRTEMEKYFSVLRVENLEKNRILLVGEIKRNFAYGK